MVCSMSWYLIYKNKLIINTVDDVADELHGLGEEIDPQKSKLKTQK